MSLIARKPEGGDFELVPQGTHLARCYMVCDLGMQSFEYLGETKTMHKVRISFELPMEKMEDGRPFSASMDYTLSLSDKAKLKAHLESWRGRAFSDEELLGFDLQTVLGAACQVTVMHKVSANNKTYPQISAITSIPKGMEAPKLINQLLYFSLAEFNQEVFNALPDWLRGKINTKGVGQQQAPQQQAPQESVSTYSEYQDKQAQPAGNPPEGYDGEDSDFLDDIPF